MFRYCGHTSQNVVVDDRVYGFPFDRPINFNIFQDSNAQRCFAESQVKISHVGLTEQGSLRSKIRQLGLSSVGSGDGGSSTSGNGTSTAGNGVTTTGNGNGEATTIRI